MRLYREFRQYVGGSGWSAVDPSACSAVVKTMGGTPLENLNASKAATGRWYIETTDALYAGGTDYQAVWTATVAGSEFTRTSVFRHVTAGGSGASAPAVPTLVRAANDLTGSSITATVAPAAGNPDDPVDVLVRLSGGDYASAGSVTGAGGGSLQIAGLDNNTWYAVNAQARAAADANARSLPAQEVWVMCHDGGNLLASALEAVVAALRGSANLAALAPDGNWARADSRGHVFVRIIDGWAGGRSPARAPYIEADLGEMTLPPRRRGDARGAIATGTLRLRVTARERDDPAAIARDVVRTLQSDANRTLGDPAHVLDVQPAIGPIERKHPVARCEVTLALRLLVEQGVSA